MALTGRAVALLLLGIAPLVALGDGSDAAYALLAGWILLAALLVALDLALAGSPRAVALERSLPARIRLDETGESVLLLTNRGSRPLRAVVRDAWQPSAGASSTRDRVRIPAGERRAIRLALTPTRRGERRPERVTIRSAGPLGLAARQATLLSPGAVRVLPPFRSRRHLPSRLARLRELDGRTALMVRGQGTEFDSLRDYVRGDDVRSIDWRATARRQDVVVRTWRPERDRRVVLVLDTGRTAAGRIQDETRLDTAFEASLLLAALATRAGDRVDLVAHDRRVRARVRAGSGGDVVSRMVDALAPVDPEILETDWSAVPALVRRIVSQRSLVVLLTAIDSPGSSRALLQVLPQLTRTHHVLVAAVLDPGLAARAADRSGRAAVYRAAAAERALLDVARVEAAVRRLGADVVTGAPADLPPALADRYIRLKATGRL
jgi:uncharacterized protein (DUF58 family)